MRHLFLAFVVALGISPAGVRAGSVCDGARPTRRVALAGNLDARTLALDHFDGTAGLAAAFTSSSFPIAVSVLGRAGTTIELLVFFSKLGNNHWTVNVGRGDQTEFRGVAREVHLRYSPSGLLRTGRRVRFTLDRASGASQRVRLDLAGMTQSSAPSGVATVVIGGCALP